MAAALRALDKKHCRPDFPAHHGQSRAPERQWAAFGEPRPSCRVVSRIRLLGLDAPRGWQPHGGQQKLSTMRPEAVQERPRRSGTVGLPAPRLRASAQARPCFLREPPRFDQSGSQSVLTEKVRGSNPLSSTKHAGQGPCPPSLPRRTEWQLSTYSTLRAIHLTGVQ